LNKPSPVGALSTFAAVLIWGTQLPIAKGAMADIDGYTVTLVRYALAVAGLLPILAWREGLAGLVPRGGGALAGAAGAIGMAGSGLLVFVGLSLTRPEAAVIIIALQPATTAIAEWALKGKRPAGFTVGCLVAAFLGVAVVVTRGGTGFDELLRTNPRELLGNALVFFGSSAWVAYALMVERLHGWSSLRISAISCLAALVTIFAVWLVALALGAARVPGAEVLATHGWRLGYLGLLGVLAAMFLWNVGSRRIGPLNAMLLVNLMPVFTFAMRAIEGANPRPTEFAGAAIVVGALVSNNLYLRHRHQGAPATPPP
jgi:drug/metabolite transporter (DMT)-like permease